MKLKSIFFTLIFFSLGALSFAQSSAKIEADKEVYRIGEPITVDFNTTSPLAVKSWVGLFKKSVPRNSTTGYLEYFYTDAKKSKKYTFKAPKDIGAYELRLFSNDPGKELLHIPLKIRANYESELSFSLVTEEIKPAQPFKVKIEHTVSVNPYAWVGIFKKNHPQSDPGGYESYQYFSNNQANIIELTAPNTSGDFQLRLYASDPGALIKMIPFRIGLLDLPGIKFSPDKQKYDPEEDMVVTYTGHKDLTDRAWIGLFKADAKVDSYVGYLTYHYLNPKENGLLTFKAPSTKGDYQIRMFYADYGPQLLKPMTFSVTSSLDKNYIKKNLDTKGKVALYGIYFDTNKSSIKSESYPIIKEIADLLNENNNLKIRIEGHTDAIGNTDYNQQLSEQRSTAVLKMLVEKYQVSKAQLQAKGFGESKPVGDNKTTQGRSKNRRVELVKF